LPMVSSPEGCAPLSTIGLDTGVVMGLVAPIFQQKY
jgi:hypothetical protein